MDSLFALCISPLIIGVVLLLLEYFVIQPIQNANDLAVLKSSPQIGPGWSNAIMSAIKQFKSYQGNPTFPLSSERIKVEEVIVTSGKATLILTVSPRTSLVVVLKMIYSWMNLRGWSVHMQSKYQVSVKPSGEIIEMKKIEETSMHEANHTGGAPPQPRDQMLLKEIEEPITKATADGIEVTINFTVENWGRRRKVHPQVHYRVAQLVNSRFEEHDVTSPDDWIVEFQPNTIHPVSFTQHFGSGSVVVLTKLPNKVRVKLIPVSTG
jgi:hypothetical protein